MFNLKSLALLGIRFYQKTLSPDHGILSYVRQNRTCKYYPTCSEYTYQSIEHYGIIRGAFLGIKRIIKCNPWSSGGYDPVPTHLNN